MHMQIVCSGGGTKGAAQAGSLEVITKRKGYADCYSGASVGAINAAWYALEKDPVKLKELWCNLKWYNVLSFSVSEIVKSIIIITSMIVFHIVGMGYISTLLGLLLLWQILSMKGFSTKKALRKTLSKYFGGAVMADVKHRLIIKTTDILHADSISYDSEEIACKGISIVDAILDSASFPGVFVPDITGTGQVTQVLADGGIMDNVPVYTGENFDTTIILTLGYYGKPKKAPGSWVTILFKVIDVMMIDDAIESFEKDPNAIVVKYPFLYERGTFDFSNLKELYIKGKKITEDVLQTSSVGKI